MGDSDTKEGEPSEKSGISTTIKTTLKGVGKALLPAPGAVAIASRPFLKSNNKLIRLGGKLYDIRYTREDIDRREKFFTTGEGSLSKPEEDLLEGIGLPKNMDLGDQLANNVVKQLPDFFNALQHCQTSAALSLSAKCYQPRFIISEIIRYSELMDQKTHEADMKKSLPSLDWMAAISSRFNGLLGRTASPAVIEGINELGRSLLTEDDMVDLFTLRV
jgi:hypothetical protein